MPRHLRWEPELQLPGMAEAGGRAQQQQQHRPQRAQQKQKREPPLAKQVRRSIALAFLFEREHPIGQQLAGLGPQSPNSMPQHSGLTISSRASPLQLHAAPRDERALQRSRRGAAPDTAGKQWFDLPATTVTDEVKRDLRMLRLRCAQHSAAHHCAAQRQQQQPYLAVPHAH